MFDALNQMELPLLDAIQSVKCGFLDTVMPLISAFADHGIGLIAVALLLIIFRKTRKTGLMCGMSLIIGLVLVNLIMKPIFDRVRPYDVNEAMRALLLIAPPDDGSFPSGHTLASFEVATVLMMRDKRFGIPALVLAVLIAFSRLYLYVHYPTDVLAGAVLGVLFGVLGVVIVDRIWNAVDKKKKAK